MAPFMAATPSFHSLHPEADLGGLDLGGDLHDLGDDLLDYSFFLDDLLDFDCFFDDLSDDLLDFDCLFDDLGDDPLDLDRHFLLDDLGRLPSRRSGVSPQPASAASPTPRRPARAIVRRIWRRFLLIAICSLLLPQCPHRSRRAPSWLVSYACLYLVSIGYMDSPYKRWRLVRPKC